VSEATREQSLARRALQSGVLKRRAQYWAHRYGGKVQPGDLESRGNFALVRIVREYDDDIGSFDDYCRRRLDEAMLKGCRAEMRGRRIEWAAELAAAELLATYRGDGEASWRDRIRDLLQATAAATFVAMVEEAQRGGDDDVVARKAYATAMAVIERRLAALSRPQRQLFLLHYREGKPLEEISGALRVHRNTLMRWRDHVLAAIRAELEAREIHHAPSRGGAPRRAVLTLLGDPEDEEGESDGEGEGDGEGAAGR
jgi:RNA polymerase sigma factor (sigma-70 family)